ncbi:putative wall-associated receptor kinase-like 16 [Panicum miliaceum]|uniref:Wall-associated receptor kinase-like 16 n=1 Tax=Panicum miliaceum TaxID=4540 RepID=A0A3L6PZD9_PANMI|nr:putative wall-associated receptor kinase-like 16 [Panicum miliaceum]
MRELRFRLLAPTTRWLLLVVAAAASLASGGSESQGPMIGLANCTTRCGDVSVPYPFGIGRGCHLKGFDLTCNTSYAPPRLFLGDGTLEVVAISLANATMRVRGPQGDTDMSGSVWKSDGTTNGTWGGPGWGLRDDAPYILSDEHNEFVLSGCHLYVELLVAGGSDDQVINSCVSTCTRALLVPHHDECFVPETSGSPRCRRYTGITCCQAPIPIGRVAYD